MTWTETMVLHRQTYWVDQRLNGVNLDTLEKFKRRNQKDVVVHSADIILRIHIDQRTRMFIRHKYQHFSSKGDLIRLAVVLVTFPF